MKAAYRYAPQGCKNVCRLEPAFYNSVLTWMIIVRSKNRILTLYSVSFDFAAHADTVNTVYWFYLRI